MQHACRQWNLSVWVCRLHASVVIVATSKRSKQAQSCRSCSWILGTQSLKIWVGQQATMVTPRLFATLRCQNDISKTIPVNVLNLPRLRKEHIIQPCVRDYYCHFELLFASLVSTWDVHQGFALPLVQSSTERRSGASNKSCSEIQSSWGDHHSCRSCQFRQSPETSPLWS